MHKAGDVFPFRPSLHDGTLPLYNKAKYRGTSSGPTVSDWLNARG